MEKYKQIMAERDVQKSKAKSVLSLLVDKHLYIYGLMTHLHSVTLPNQG